MASAEYYYFPLKPADLIQKKEHPRVSLKESVSGMIHLITITHFGEYKADESLGCEIWESDFENVTNSQLFKEQVKTSLMQSIATHEPRISQIKIDIQVQQVELVVKNRRTKSKVTLKVDGVLKKTNEPFSYSEYFFIGPLSYY
jgi:phage baseplate assembly protein W